MDDYVIDGTYELFRHYYAVPSARESDGREVGAVRGVIASVLALIGQGAHHLGVATDHVIESFRNRLWPGYKTGDGIEPDLLAQFPLLEEALVALGVAVWPMVEFEADDALASAAAVAAGDPRVDRVVICTPDKDLAQCVSGTRVVQLNRRTRTTLDEGGVMAKYGVPPPRFLITWRSWVMPQTAIPGCKVGGRSRRPPCSRATATSRRFHQTRARR